MCKIPKMFSYCIAYYFLVLQSLGWFMGFIWQTTLQIYMYLLNIYLYKCS